VSFNHVHIKFALARLSDVVSLHGNVLGEVVAFCICLRTEVLGHYPGDEVNVCHIVVDDGMVRFTVTAIFLKSFRGNITILDHHLEVFAFLGHPGIVVNIEGVEASAVVGIRLIRGALVERFKCFVIPDEWNTQALDCFVKGKFKRSSIFIDDLLLNVVNLDVLTEVDLLFCGMVINKLEAQHDLVCTDLVQFAFHSEVQVFRKGLLGVLRLSNKGDDHGKG